MKNVVYITGHRNPDTDTICSAIGYSELKNKLGTYAVPIRLGDLNKETEFVLNYFGVERPEYLNTVKTQVSDLNMDVVNVISTDISIKTAWTIMTRNKVKTLPVVDEDERLIGVVTLSDITNKYMEVIDNNTLEASNTTLSNIVETLNAKLLCGNNHNFKTTGKVVIAASESDSKGDYIEQGDIVIVGGRKNSIRRSIELGANCIIVTCGAKPDESILELSKEHKCIIMTTQSDSFTTARLINQSVPIGSVMTKDNIVKFNINDFIDDIKDKMLSTRYRSYPVVDDNDRVKGFISRYHLISQRRKKVILLDHNEKSQAINGIEQAEILEIIDHHRLGDIQTVNPVFFKNEPVGSTSTIIANMYFEAGIRPSKKIAGIMCAAIISDTINFKSPTTTHFDLMNADKLAEIAGVDIEELAMLMFNAGFALGDECPEEIFSKDFKEFKFGKYKVGVAQVYTMDFESLNSIKTPLIEYMNKFCTGNRFDLVMLLVTDIIRQGSELLYAGEAKEIIFRAFNIELGENSIYLPDVVSRKKQVIPKISMATL